MAVYTEQITAEHYCLLFFVFKIVDCSGAEFFRISILYSSSAISIIISKMIAFLSGTEDCVSTKDFCFCRSFTVASSFMIFCSCDYKIVNGVLFSKSKLPIFLDIQQLSIYIEPPYFYFASGAVS